MACPTCDHTMHGLGERWFWCPRCGTILNGDNPEYTVSLPKAVESARAWVMKPTYVSMQHFQGVLRSEVLNPEERSALEKQP